MNAWLMRDLFAVANLLVKREEHTAECKSSSMTKSRASDGQTPNRDLNRIPNRLSGLVRIRTVAVTSPLCQQPSSTHRNIS